MHSSTGHRLGGYTFEACIFGAVRVRYKVEEVVVHGLSWEVVVHVATEVEVVVHGDGSCTRVGEELGASKSFGVPC